LVVEVVDRDADGELICRPVQWDNDADPPPIMLAPGPQGEGKPARPRIGERFLARLSRNGDGYEARVIKTSRRQRAQGARVFASSASKAASKPSTAKAKQEFVVAEGRHDWARRTANLSSPNRKPARAMGLPRGPH